ncbi:MAG TPA: hypothetical protein VN515_03435, partial [Terriglobales bacterium]|nr:hypothetical protein [Terriglobales bacterium]
MQLGGLVGVACMCGLSACGGAMPAPTSGSRSASAIVVEAAATPPTVAAGASAALTAVVADDPTSAGVTWTLAPGEAGTLVTVDTLHGTYVAPALFPAPADTAIIATAVADATKSTTVEVQVVPVATVTIAAGTSDLGPAQSTQIIATVANGAVVNFALAAGAPGTVAQSGPLQATYRAPSPLGQPAAAVVTATAAEDASQSAAVTINLHPVAVSVTNGGANPLGPSQTTQLTAVTAYDGGAGVAWTLAPGAAGSVTTVDTSHASYTAPATIAPNTPAAVVIATSLADATRSAAAAVALAGTVADPEVDPSIDTSGVWQNLVQFQNDLARQGSAVPPYAAMLLDSSLQPINPNDHPNVFQSNLLIFHDTQTNAEVWRLDNDPTSETAMPGPINRQPWDANGSHFEVWSNRRVPINQYGSNLNYIFNANASQVSLVQPTDPRRAGYMQNQTGFASGLYLPWDPVTPGVFYLATWQDAQQPPPAPNPDASLYAVEANDSAFTMTKIADLPNPSLRKEIQSYPAGDGLIMVDDFNSACKDAAQEGVPSSPCTAGPVYVPSIYMVASNPADPSFGGVKYQFPINFNLSRFAGYGHDVSDEFHVHDIYFRRDASDSFIFNFGPRGDAGETVFFEAPVNGAAAQIQVAYSAVGNSANQVGGTPYYSHPAWNFDGSQVAYYGERTYNNSDGPYAVWVRNHDAGQTLGSVGPSFGHAAWDGFDPSYIAYDIPGAADPVTGYQTFGEYSSNPSVMGTAPRLLVHARLRNPNASPGLLEGPAQSPDATKVMFTLPERWQAGSPRNVFIVVDHRPLPPALSAASSGASVALSWTPYLSHREIAGYHVYRSPRGAGAFQEIDGGLITGTTFTDAGAAAGAVYDYAVTAQENSGLESSRLSNIE